MAKPAFYRSEFKNHTLKQPLSAQAAAVYRSGSKSVTGHLPMRNIAYRTGTKLFDKREQTPHD